MSKDIVEVSTQNFSRGLVTVKPDHLCEDGESPNVSNVDFSKAVGRVTKRKGYSIFQNSNSLSSYITGLYEYVKASGTTVYYTVCKSILYEITPASTWTTRLPADYQTVTSLQTDAVGFPNKVQVNKTSHGYSIGDTIYFFGAASPCITVLNGNSYTILAGGFTADTFFVTQSIIDGPATYSTNPGYMARTSGTPTNIGDASFATFGDNCVVVSPNITTSKSTGSTFSPLLGTPPSNAKYIKSHRNRLWIANSSAGKSRVSYSALGNGEDWTTSGDAGYVDVGIDDGEQITGLATAGPNLVVFKQNSTWIIKNGTPTTFTLQKLGSVGCVAPKSVVECDSFVLFLSNYGVYAANQNGLALMSYNVQPDFDSMSNATKALACAGRLRSQYWLSVDTDSNSINDTAYVLDYVYGIWSKYSNKKENVYYTRQDGKLISGAHDTDVIRLHDDTENDNGSAITMTYDSPAYQFGDWVKRKQMHDIVLKTNAITGKTITVSHVIDGTSQANTKVFNLDAVLSGNDQVIHKFYHPPDTSYGLNIRIRFTNAETSATVQIFGFSVRAKIRERENG